MIFILKQSYNGITKVSCNETSGLLTQRKTREVHIVTSFMEDIRLTKDGSIIELAYEHIFKNFTFLDRSLFLTSKVPD